MSSSRLKVDDNKRRLKKKRIANDEFEAITLIVQTNEILRKRIMMRIHELRAMSKESMFDVGRKAKKTENDGDLTQVE